MTDAMHSSTAGLRPRQRTFTSCTECRRRKQRCNQAKDRPCNNCARRYPPVDCVYESTSPTPTHNRIVDYQGQSSTTNFVTTTQPDMTNFPAATSPDNHYYSPATVVSPYYSHTPSSSSSMRPEYRTFPDTSSSGYTTNTTTGGYFPPVQTTGFNAVSSSSQGYYPNTANTDQSQGDWFAINGDAASYGGTGTGEYYFDPETGNGAARR